MFRGNFFRKTWMGMALIALSGMYLASATAQRPAGGLASNVLVLRGGRLIDGTGRAPIEKSAIVIEGAKITAAGEEGKVKIPAGAKVINTTGKTVIPGLVDAHVHIGGDSFLPVFLYWGVTTVGDMTNQPSWILQEKRAAETREEPSPSILTVLGGVDDPPYGARIYKGENLREIKDESAMEAAIVERKQMGADGIKFFAGIPSPLLKRGVEIAHREGLPTFCHCSSQTRGRGTDEWIDTGLDVQIHTFGLEKATVTPAVKEQIQKGDIPYPEYLMDPATFPALAQKMVDRKMALNPTLSFPFGKFSKYRAEFDQALTAFFAGPVGSAFLNPLAEDERARFADKFKPFDANPNYKGQRLEQIQEGLRKMGQFVKVFMDKGGKIVGAPDIGGGPNAGWNTPGFSLHVEMQMLQEAGLTPMQILQATTLSSMEAWRKEAEAGSISAGKRADVVVLNRNPLEDISATRDIQTIIKNGRIVDREALAKWKPRFPNGPYLKPSTAPRASIEDSRSAN